MLFFINNNISIVLIDRVFRNFDYLKKTIRMQNKHVSMSEQTPQNIYIITKTNSGKLGITISGEVTGIILI